MADTTKGSNLINKKHPHYARISPEWEFWALSYLGGMDYIKDHLAQYYKEGDTEYAGRKARSYRENHTKRVVDIINSYLFQEDPIRETGDKNFKAFMSNSDGKGLSMAQFMKRASLWGKCSWQGLYCHGQETSSRRQENGYKQR